MLTTVEAVGAIPGMGNVAAVPIAWLNSLIGAADSAIKSYLKRDIELQAYVEFYSGEGQTDIVINQYPVLYGQTTIAAGSSGAVLPQTTINVVSTAGFNPGTAGNPNATPPSLAVQTGLTTWTTVTYTGTTATTFTGCSGGTGTLTSVSGFNGVASPVVFYDPAGYYGQSQNAFAPSTQLVLGSQFVVLLDSGGKVSNRGLLRKIGGTGQGFVGFYPEIMYGGKLSATRLPSWPRGDGSLKVQYSAGYRSGKVPLEIGYATAMLVAQMVRVMPSGAPLSSEGIGAYSYSVLTSRVPEMGDIRRSLATYRESSW